MQTAIDDYINLIKNHVPNITGVKNVSSILIPLIEISGQWHVLYEKRALTLKSQPGEICFPGGAIEKNESSSDAAIRETCEELNLESSKIEWIGQLDSILTSFDMIIHCHVGIIKCQYEDIAFSKDEVDEIFTVPLSFLLEYTPQTYWIQSNFDISDDFPFDNIPNGKNYNFKNSRYPIVFYNYGAYNIWGLTARMTKQLVEMVKSGQI